MTEPSNAPQVAARLRRVGAAVRAELAAELRRQAGLVAVRMKLEAPKDLSALTNSVREERVSDEEWLVRPTVAYAKWVVHGRKPGKGLPRFFDLATGGVQGWLDRRLMDARRAVNPKYRRARIGSGRRTAEELELRDRYWALSRAIKARGIKPDPFIERTAAAVAPDVRAALRAAAARAVAGRGDLA